MKKVGDPVFTWTMTTFPGDDDCAPDVVVFHSVSVHPLARGQGIGQQQHQVRLTEARARDYQYALCTVRADNVVERHILAKNGWKQLDVFTGHGGDVCVYGKEL